jgi:predicted phosphodiesterase
MQRVPIANFHDARLSLVQSCLREVVARFAGDEPGPGLASGGPIRHATAAVLGAIDRGQIADAAAAIASYRKERESAPAPAQSRGTVGTGRDCLDLLVEYALAWAFHNQPKMEEIRGEFADGPCDPGWLKSAGEWLAYYWSGKAPHYNPPSADGPAAIPLPRPASADGVLRVGVLGDWGTGEPDAIAVLDELMRLAPDLILHVGDVYHSGTPDECRTNFLDPINAARAKFARPVPVYSLAGNHDYYSGGAGYYGMLARLNEGIPGATIQAHSFFCLRNDAWQVQAMDTGYNDHDLLAVDEDITWLRDDEARWHAARLAEAGSRRVILLSHHQLFSAFQPIGSSGKDFRNPYLAARLAAWRATGADVVLWLWGHEHLLEVYDEPTADGQGLPVRGRCIGHGAFPIFNNEGLYTPKTGGIPLAPAPGFPGGYVQTDDDGLVYARGFAMLELGPASGKAAYYQVFLPPDGSAPSTRALWSDDLAPQAAR